MAITPGGRVGDASPLGKGKRRVLDDYVREVAHALMRKGFSKPHAIATAKNSLKRWSGGGGKVRPQVRAGAAAHLGAQKALDAGGRRDLAGSIGAVPIDLAAVTAPAVSSQDGPRVRLIAEMAKRKKPKMAPGRKLNLSVAERGAIIDLVGPKGYSHGWVRAGDPVKGVSGGKHSAAGARQTARNRATAELAHRKAAAVPEHTSAAAAKAAPGHNVHKMRGGYVRLYKDGAPVADIAKSRGTAGDQRWHVLNGQHTAGFATHREAVAHVIKHGPGRVK